MELYTDHEALCTHTYNPRRGLSGSEPPLHAHLTVTSRGLAALLYGTVTQVAASHIQSPIQVLAAPLSIQLPADAPGKVAKDSPTA